jgi:hypothetical protein
VFRRPEPRDLEILRTVARLRYVTTPQIERVFFTHARIARRRMQILAEQKLVHLHQRGLPPRTPWGAWRITQRGIGRVLDAFPEEVLPDNLAELVAEGSLLNFEEHAVGAQLYLDVLAPKVSFPFDGSRVMFCRWWSLQVSRRASAVGWARKGAVKLRGINFQVIPDATLAAPARKTRVFIYFDAPWTRARWVAEQLRRHDVLAPFQHPADHLFGDGCAPSFLFITKNAYRVRDVGEALHRVPVERIHVAVLQRDHAMGWLEERLFGAPMRAVG